MKSSQFEPRHFYYGSRNAQHVVQPLVAKPASLKHQKIKACARLGLGKYYSPLL